VAASFIGLLRLGIHHVPIFGSSPTAGTPDGGFVVRAVRSNLTRALDGSEAGPSHWLVQRAPACHHPPSWSRGDSNPGPPPCKGGALPTKLRPPARSRRSRTVPGWARLDSNQGPRPYQGRALTS
jgi:hypothetical protein